MEDFQKLQRPSFSAPFGAYRLLSLLGEGADSQVFLAEHVERHERVALKIWQVRLGRQDEASFLAEAGQVARLRHPGIMPTRDYGVLTGKPFLAMDIAPGGSLRRRYPPGSRMAARTLLPLIQPICEALQYAHQQGILHRNLKPENLLLGARGLLLSDFAVATGTQSLRTRNLDTLAASMQYYAPELLRGKPEPRSDLYALAAMLYEWLGGKPLLQFNPRETANLPFTGQLPPLPAAFASAELNSVIATALASEPERRFGSLVAFVRAFDQAVENRYVAGPAISVSQFNPATPAPSLPISSPGVSATPGPQFPPAGPPPATPVPSGSFLPSSNLTQASADQLPTMRQSLNHPPAMGGPAVDQVQTHAQIQQGAVAGSIPSETPPPKGVSQATSSRVRGGRAWQWLLVALACWLVLAELGVLANLRIFQPAQINQQHAQATQTVLHATQVVVNATQTATEALTPGYLYASLATRQPLISDAITNTELKNWVTTGSVPCPTQQGSLFVQKTAPNKDRFSFCKFVDPQALKLYDYACQFDVAVQGSEGGLLFRLNSTLGVIRQTFYLFLINPHGSYGLNLFQGSFQYLAYQSSPAIKTGQGTVNRLTVIVVQNWIYLFANGQYLLGLQNTASNGGGIGAVVYSNAATTSALFSHLTLWKI